MIDDGRVSREGVPNDFTAVEYLIANRMIEMAAGLRNHSIGDPESVPADQHLDSMGNVLRQLLTCNYQTIYSQRGAIYASLVQSGCDEAALRRLRLFEGLELLATKAA